MAEKSKKQTKKSTNKKAKKWNDQHRAAAELMTQELEGILKYIRSLHLLAMALLIVSISILIFSLRVLFANGEHAVVGFLIIILTCLSVMLTSVLAMRPWVLPRFLLPLDMKDFDVKGLLALFKDPEEYLLLIKNHIEILTYNFLLPKLGYLKNSIALLIFGISIAIILSVALP